MRLLTMAALGLWTPRVVMHWQDPSITIAPPLGCNTSFSVSAIGGLSCTSIIGVLNDAGVGELHTHPASLLLGKFCQAAKHIVE
jgi:hypothetical protein